MSEQRVETIGGGKERYVSTILPQSMRPVFVMFRS